MLFGALGIVGRLFGLCCFSSRGKFSLALAWWSATCVLIFVSATVLAQYQELDLSAEDSLARRFIVTSLVLTDILISVIHFIVQIMKRHMFEEFFLYTRKTSNGIFDHVIALWGIIIFGGMVLDPWDEQILQSPSAWGYWRHDLTKLYHFIVFIITIQFCSLISRVSLRLELTRSLLPKVDTAVHHHATLTYLAKNANRLWNIQLLLICVHIFGYVVLLIYQAVSPVIHDTEETPEIQKFLNVVLTICLILTQLACLARTCHQTTFNADAFNDELFKLLEDHPSLAKDDRLNMYLCFNETVSFSACGFFGLGYPMITAITASAASFLVILLQSV